MDKKILYTHQSCFCKHHSTDTCLSYLTDKVLKGFKKVLLTGMILTNLHRSLGFRSYLANTSFSVNVGKDFSTPGKLTCGVLRGSIVGPLLCYCPRGYFENF